MKWTRVSVEEDAQKKGLELVQFDGIPEGFLWKEADVTIGGAEYTGKYVLYGPLGEDVVKSDTPEALVKVYDSIVNKKSHPQNHAKENLERARGSFEN